MHVHSTEYLRYAYLTRDHRYSVGDLRYSLDLGRTANDSVGRDRRFSGSASLACRFYPHTRGTSMPDSRSVAGMRRLAPSAAGSGYSNTCPAHYPFRREHHRASATTEEVCDGLLLFPPIGRESAGRSKALFFATMASVRDHPKHNHARQSAGRARLAGPTEAATRRALYIQRDERGPGETRVVYTTLQK